MSKEDGNSKHKSPSGQQKSFEIAGKKVRVGQSMTPQEAEAFVQAILENTPGPVTISTTNQVTGTTTSAVADNWEEYKESPQTNADTLSKLRVDLERHGYLALYDQTTGTLDLDNDFISLSHEYFRDFDHFDRCQDIPNRYHEHLDTIDRRIWFISHRWESLSHPDPDRQQFQAVQNLIEQEDIQGIWYDYSCMPQEPMTTSELETFRNSLRDLNALIASANFASIVTDDYETRAWCYYEMMIAELLCAGKKCTIAKGGYSSQKDILLPQLLFKGMVPELKITRESDRHHVLALLVTGVKVFKAAAIAVSLGILNDFGFKFGVGASSRYSEFVHFEQFWRIWRLLAASSEHGGIRFRHLVDPQYLRDIIGHRFDLLNGHVKLFAELPRLMRMPLDLRIVEQGSLDRLQEIISDTLRKGPVKDSYTPLAIVMLVYALGTREAFVGDSKEGSDSSDLKKSAIDQLVDVYGLTEATEKEHVLSQDEKISSQLNFEGYELAESGLWTEAIPYYRKALEHNSKNAVALTNLGNAYQALGRLEEALKYQLKALEIDPDNALVWANKAVILSRLGQRKKALECYDRSLQIDPFSKNTWFSRGSLLFTLGSSQEAIECFEHILRELDPRMKECWGAKSEVLKSIGDCDGALKCLDEFLKIDPDDGQVLAEKASVMVTAGRSESALTSFDKALRLNPDVAKTWYNKGHALQTLARDEEAIQCYDQAIELDPEYAPAWGNKAACLALASRDTEALSCVKRSLELDPSSGGYWFLLGLICHKRNDYAEALRAFTQAHGRGRADAQKHIRDCQARLKIHDSQMGVKTEKQRKSSSPRALCNEEVLVVFALDAAASEVDDDWFQESFQRLCSPMKSKGVWFGSWTVLRIPDMRIDIPGSAAGQFELPDLLIDELERWSGKQQYPELAQVVSMQKFTEKNCFALMIHVPDSTPEGPQ